MFANNSAIKILVKTDTSASEIEKNAVLDILSRKFPTDKACKLDRPVVVKVRDASKMLSVSRATIYAMVKNQVLTGFYSSANKKRIAGIVLDSIHSAMKKRGLEGEKK